MKLGSVYFCSRGLARATSYNVMDFDIKPLLLPFFENDYVKVLDFNLDNLNRSQLLYLITNIKEKKFIFEKSTKNGRCFITPPVLKKLYLFLKLY